MKKNSRKAEIAIIVSEMIDLHLHIGPEIIPRMPALNDKDHPLIEGTMRPAKTAYFTPL